MKWWILGTAFVILANVSYPAKAGYQDASDACTISKYVTKLGCFKDRHGILDEELINARNPKSHHFTGLVISWFQLKKTINKLLCKCAKKARTRGFQYIGLKNFGECWSGANERFYDKEGSSNMCMQEYMKPCNVNNNDHGCLGFQGTNYMYRVLPEAGGSSPSVHKGKSESKPKEEQIHGQMKGGQGSKGNGNKGSKSKGSKSKGTGRKASESHSKSKGKGKGKGHRYGNHHRHRSHRRYGNGRYGRH